MSEILFYGEIGWEITVADIAEQVKNADKSAPIVLRINSGGGSVIDGLAIISALNRHEGGVHAEIEGIAASMAAVIAMQADRVSMPEDGWLMFHRIRGGGGTAPELKQQADVIEAMERNLVSFLAARLDKSESEITTMLDGEIWLNGADAFAAGLIHEATQAAVMAASIDSDKFFNIPEAAKNYLDIKGSLDSQSNRKAKTHEAPILVFLR